MASEQTVYMNQGEGETSYARSSILQNICQSRMKPLIEEAITDLCGNTTLLPASMVIVDLGCSSGSNALVLVSAAVDAVRRHCLQHQQSPPELCVLLNDLPNNDFNTVVKSLVLFQQSHESLVTAVVPGSFYGRLFISGSLHLACSSNSLHWLSKAPEDLVKNRIPAYDGNKHVRQTRLPVVLGAYARQFREDFTLFLGLRAQEMVSGGRMVLSLAGRRFTDIASQSTHAWESVACALNDMALRGVIDREKLDSFYIPIYGPSDKELREIIEEEGSFLVGKMQVHEATSGADKALITPRTIANMLRAGFEPIIVQHFGSSGEIMDEFVRTVERQMSFGGLQDAIARNPRVQLAVSLTRRT